jgi:hypothetical protein
MHRAIKKECSQPWFQIISFAKVLLPMRILLSGANDVYLHIVTFEGIGSVPYWCWRSSDCICWRLGQVRAKAIL